MRSMIFAAAASLALAAAAHAAPPTATATTLSTKPGMVMHSKTTATAEKPRTAASLACSGQADAKKLHGKPRNAFMKSCKKAAK